jgi:hypothetical protein
VADIEEGINFHETEIDLIRAEVFAHHHACRELIKGRYRLPLGYYLDAIEDMAKSPSEYIRIAAKEVIDSPEWADYKSHVSPFYGG